MNWLPPQPQANIAAATTRQESGRDVIAGVVAGEGAACRGSGIRWVSGMGKSDLREECA
ncbi:hypothetical protein Misp03_86250 [Microbispora sp. NBRC 16548]|nr:hypothetical protein Misp03_86250 [Microbispora sp. NBRC 16548]